MQLAERLARGLENAIAERLDLDPRGVGEAGQVLALAVAQEDLVFEAQHHAFAALRPR
jgi:hypothetical protein